MQYKVYEREYQYLAVDLQTLDGFIVDINRLVPLFTAHFNADSFTGAVEVDAKTTKSVNIALHLGAMAKLVPQALFGDAASDDWGDSRDIRTGTRRLL